MLRVGVIGTGSMGRHHVRIYAGMDDINLVGISDIDQVRSEELARTYQTKAYQSSDDLLNESLDAVSIAVPTTFHKEVALAAIAEGCNVLIEKPIADTIENASEIIEAAQSRGTKLMVGHIERFNPALIKLKELVERGQLGEIISISAKRVGPYNPRIRDVGIIIDLATHDIDIMSYLFNAKVSKVYASAGSVVHNHEDHAIITLNFNNGGSGMIETNWLTPHKMRNLTVIGSKGIAEVNYIESTLRIFDREWVKDAKIEKDEPLKLELQHFIDCLQQNKEPLVSGENGLHALTVALAAMESSHTKKVVTLK